MIGRSKNSTENYPRKCFSTHEIETQVKFNPGLSANRPSNNWAQEFLDSVLQEQKIPGFRNPDCLTLGDLTSIEPLRSHPRSVRQL